MNARTRLAAGVVALLFSTALWADEELRTATSTQFSVGQVWKYKTREGETASRAHVGKIDSIGDNIIVHVKLTGLVIKAGGEVGSVVAHTPIAEEALARSVTELTSETPNLEQFSDGYAAWREAFDAEDAGWFTLSLAEVVGTIEAGLN
ncbi:MAG: hypothetical protein FJ091_21905 [Deltaproteobacteria bacterium]|nr:hypothetical protein [Deltaproteobacteria bacterium]